MALAAPNERALFRVHDAVGCFVDRCLSRKDSESRHFEEHFAEFFSSRPWPNIVAGFFLFVFFFPKFRTLFSKTRAHSKRYWIFPAGISGIQPFYANRAFPLSSVLSLRGISLKKACIHTNLLRTTATSLRSMTVHIKLRRQCQPLAYRPMQAFNGASRSE